MKQNAESHISSIIRAYDTFMEDPHTLNALLDAIEKAKRFRDSSRVRDNLQLTLRL